MMVDPKYKLELLVAYTIGATTTACGFVITALSAWMMDTGWAAAGVALCVFLIPLQAAIKTYIQIKPTLPGRGDTRTGACDKDSQ